MNTKIQNMIHCYLDAWNQNNLTDIKSAFSKVLSKSLKYTDPSFDVTGVDALVNMALASLEKFPGRKFELLTEPEFHHQVGYYSWRVVFADGTYRGGLDCFEFDKDFFITRIIAFF